MLDGIPGLPITVTFAATFVGAILIAVFAIVVGAFSSTHWGTVPNSAWAAVVYSVLFATIGAYVLNGWGLQFVNPSTPAAYGCVQPGTYFPVVLVYLLL